MTDFIKKLLLAMTARFGKHNLSQTGGALAYFFLLSFFPFLVIVNAILSLLGIAQTQLAPYLASLFPGELGGTVAKYYVDLSSVNAATALSLNLIVLIYSASRFVRALIRAFDLAWEVKEPGNIVRRALRSMGFTLLIAVGFSIIFALSLLGQGLIEYLMRNLPKTVSVLAMRIRSLLVISILFLFTGTIYKTLPNARMRVREIIPGTLFSGGALLLLGVGFDLYISFTQKSTSIYGSAGAVVMLVLYAYFAGIILLLGCELNSLLAQRRKSP